MQFISNKISVGSTKSFDDICQEFLDKKNATVKTASTTEAVKVAEADEAEGSGQLEVEPLHQEGESTNQDSVAGGKSDGDGGKTSTKSSDEEGEDSGQPKAEGSEKFTNDPKVDADAGSDTEIKEADAKEDEDEEKEAATDKDDAEGEEKEDSADSEVKEAGIKGNCKDCGKPNFLCKCKGKGNGPGEGKGDGQGDGTGKCDKEEDKEEDKEASTKPSFTKIANLTSEEKTRLGKFWKNLYPADFVDAMLADK